MLLIHVTKDGRCAYCNAGVIKCAEPTCQGFFFGLLIIGMFFANLGVRCGAIEEETKNKNTKLCLAYPLYFKALKF